MPHIKKWLIDGEIAPSVNQVTDLIPKEWLIKWYRKVGFEEADRISKTSREHGTNIHELFDRFWKGDLKQDDLSELERNFVRSMATWSREKNVQVLHSEPHLESKLHKFHGSPDLITKVEDYNSMTDYKVKDKYPDYKTILNEAGYAIMAEEMFGIKIDKITILNFNKETGDMFEPIVIDITKQFISDFLQLRAAYYVKLRADEWDEVNIRSKFKRAI